jgi:hypothetical protein
MIPLETKHTNVVFGEKQPEYEPLPAFRTSEGIVVTTWQPTDEERKKIADGANITLSVMTFNQPYQPVLPIIFTEAEQDEYINTIS